ncbi:hypothetical protein Adt_39438 [Abeliophyllum distichum]|uniref:Uncharacterized protein n=1 Tax=Abeliophyllum distichum TaxID=126358 RepID=A0ABD1Q523_9LAMI
MRMLELKFILLNSLLVNSASAELGQFLLCYSNSFKELFHTINEDEARIIKSRNNYLRTSFSLVPFNPTFVTHALFNDIRCKFFVSNVHFMFHTLESNPPSKSPRKMSSSSAPGSKKGVTSHLVEVSLAQLPSTSPTANSGSKRPTPPQADDSDEEDTHAHTRKKIDKEKAPVSSDCQPQVDILSNLPREVPLSPKLSDEDVDSVLRSIQALFTSWEQVQTSSVPRTSSTTRPSTSSIPSTVDMDALKKVVLAYTSFVDKDISKASTNSRAELLVHLSEDLAAALKRPTLALSASVRLTLREIHSK